MSLFGSLQVSSSGMSAQRTRAELLVENMANSETTRTPEGGPYRRKDVVFETASFQDSLGTAMSGGVEGVHVSEVVEVSVESFASGVPCSIEHIQRDLVVKGVLKRKSRTRARLTFDLAGSPNWLTSK